MTLSVKQEKVVALLFEGIPEDELLVKASVTRSMFRKWLSQKAFVDALASRVSAAAVTSRMMIARQSPLAVERLVKLAASENGETARKACLDILELGAKGAATAEDLSLESAPTQGKAAMTPEQQSRLLAAMAGDKTEPDAA